MAITIPCTQCGHENELGRIFCGRCGERIDTSQLSPESIARRQRPAQIKAFIKTLAGLIFLAVLGAAAIVFWPVSVGAPEGKKRPGKHEQTKLEGLHASLQSGTPQIRKYTEKQINHYLAFVNEEEPGRTLVDLTEEGFAFQVRRGIGVIKIGDFSTPNLQYSYTLMGTIEDGRISFGKVLLGHLPFPGPLKRIFVSKARNRVLKDLEHEAVFDNIANISLDDERLEVTFKR